jgi:hypothetical protein
MVSGPPTREAGLGRHLRFGLIIAIGLIWATSPHGLPGTPDDDDEEPVQCPHCDALVHSLPLGLYRCDGKHFFTAKQARRRKE